MKKITITGPLNVSYFTVQNMFTIGCVFAGYYACLYSNGNIALANQYGDSDSVSNSGANADIVKNILHLYGNELVDKSGTIDTETYRYLIEQAMKFRYSNPEKNIEAINNILEDCKIDVLKVEFKDGHLVGTDPHDTFYDEDLVDLIVNDVLDFENDGNGGYKVPQGMTIPEDHVEAILNVARFYNVKVEATDKNDTD